MERALQELLDRQALVDLVGAYARAMDLQRSGDLVELFTEDAVLDYGPGFGVIRGREAMRARFGSGQRIFESSRHYLTNIKIDFEGPDRASGVTYLYAWHRFGEGKPDGHVYGEYRDRFVRESGGWRIADRRLLVAAEQDFPTEWAPIPELAGC